MIVREAVVRLEPGTDPGAPGAAVTVALCGHWEHEGACRWPHCTAVSPDGELHRLRILVASPPEELDGVVEKVAGALAAGRLPGQPGQAWGLVSHQAAVPTPEEAEHLHRLQATRGPGNWRGSREEPIAPPSCRSLATG